jgi:hypothetical protein
MPPTVRGNGFTMPGITNGLVSSSAKWAQRGQASLMYGLTKQRRLPPLSRPTHDSFLFILISLNLVAVTFSGLTP